MKIFRIIAVWFIVISLTIIPALTFADHGEGHLVFTVEKTTTSTVTLKSASGRPLKMYLSEGIAQNRVKALEGKKVWLTFDGKPYLSIRQTLGFFKSGKIIVTKINGDTKKEDSTPTP